MFNCKLLLCDELSLDYAQKDTKVLTLYSAKGITILNCTRPQVYIELRLQEDTHLCVFIYGGQPPGEWELREENLPEGWICVVCSGGKPIVSDNKLPSNFRLAKPDDFIPDLVRP